MLREATRFRISVPATPYQSWYVLARNLMDFFETVPYKRSGDAILAGDFFHPPRYWHAKRQAIVRPMDYSGYRRAAHKRAAHLTYARAAYRAKGGKTYDPSAEVSAYLLELARLFLALLTEEHQGWFRATDFPLPWR